MDRRQFEYGSQLDFLDQVRPFWLDFISIVLTLHSVIIGGAFSALMCFVPETLPRLVIKRNVERHGSVDENAIAVATTKVNVMKEISFVTTMAFRIMFTEPIVTFLAIYK